MTNRGLTNIERATVTSSVASDVTASLPSVTVLPSLSGEEIEAVVAPNVFGSGHVLGEGHAVLVAHNGSSGVVLKSLYTEDKNVTEAPNLSDGERHESHPASEASVEWQEDGTLAIDGDVDVVVNGGSTAPVTDVTVSTSTDSDGHVTSVSLNITRANNIFVPSN